MADWSEEHRQYYAQHQGTIEGLLSDAVGEAVWAQADNPLEFIGRRLMEKGAAGSLGWTGEGMAAPPASVASKPTEDELMIKGAVKLAKERWRATYPRVKDLAKAEKGSAEEEELMWRMHKWLAGPVFDGDSTLADLLSSTLIKPLQTERDESMRHLEMSYIKALGSYPDSQVILKTLQSDNFVEKLAEALWEGAKRLHEDSLESADDEQTGISKFFDDEDKALDFGNTSHFFRGLDGFIGPPNPNLRETMQMEHCESHDSRDLFKTPNYGTDTTPRIEYWFVVEPSKERRDELGIRDWPVEDHERVDDSNPSLRPYRRVQGFESFEFAFNDHNMRLKSKDMDPLQKVEFFGGRLYTGPMYVKYNHVLRVIGRVHLNHHSKVNHSDFVDALSDENQRVLTRGNTYTTTLHVINSAVVKLSQLTVAAKVYRGISGKALPERMRKHAADNTRGGIEFGFLSCSLEREVAHKYATSHTATPPLLFEMRMGMIDRGADFSWFSQYPHEKEILFAPLTGIGIESYRVVHDVLIASVRPSVNLQAKTIEQVMSKMRTSHIQLVTLLEDSLRFAGVPPRALAPLTTYKIKAELDEPSQYNSAAYFSEATQRALDMQKQVFHALADPEEPLEVGSSVFYRTAELAANAGLHHLAVDLLVQWRQVEERRRLHAPSAALGVSVAADPPSAAPVVGSIHEERRAMRSVSPATAHRKKLYLSDIADELLDKGVKVPWAGTLVELCKDSDDRYNQLGLDLDDLKKLINKVDALCSDRFAVDCDVLVKEKGSAERWVRARVTRARYDGQGKDGQTFLAYDAKTYHELEALQCNEILAPGTSGLGSMLREAARVGNAKLVTMLLDAGASAFETDMQADTALIIAAKYATEADCAGHVAVCQILKKKMDGDLRNVPVAGKAQDLHNDNRQNAFDIAVKRRIRPIVRVLTPNPSDESPGASLKKLGELVKEFASDFGSEFASNKWHDHKAAELATFLIKRTEWPWWCEETGVTTLMVVCRYAACQGPTETGELKLARELVSSLLDRDPSCLNKQSKQNCTALTIAAEEGDAGMVRLLLDRKADINFVDTNTGRNTLFYAATSGHREVVQMLLDEPGLDPKRGGANLVRFKAGSKGKAQDGAQTNIDKRTILMTTCQHGYQDVAKLLVERGGADICALNGKKESALMFASRYGFAKVIKFLLRPGNDIKGVDINGEVLSEVVNGEVKDVKKWTSLHRAAGNGHVDAASELLRHWQMEHPIVFYDNNKPDRREHDKYINWQSEQGVTALMAAASSGYEGMTAFLMDQGADPGVELLTKLGESTLIYTASAGQEGTLGLLLNRKGGLEGANGIDFVTSLTGESALLKACKKGHVGVVRALLDAKATIDLKVDPAESLIGMRWQECDGPPGGDELELDSPELSNALLKIVEKKDKKIEKKTVGFSVEKSVEFSVEECAALLGFDKRGDKSIDYLKVKPTDLVPSTEHYVVVDDQANGRTRYFRPREQDSVLMIAARMGHEELMRCLLINDAKDRKKEAEAESVRLKLQTIIDLMKKQKNASLKRWSTHEQLFFERNVRDERFHTPDTLKANQMDDELAALGGFKRQFGGQLVPLRPSGAEMAGWKGGKDERFTACGKIGGYADGGVVLQRGPFNGIWLRVGCVAGVPWHRLWSVLKQYVDHFATCERMTALNDAICRSHADTLRERFESTGKPTVDLKVFYREVEALGIDLYPERQRKLAIHKFFEQHSERMRDTERWYESNEFAYPDFEWKKKNASAIYIAISMNALQAVDVTWLIEQHGFRFHHYRPAGHGLPIADEQLAREADGSGEMVYYCWPGLGGNGAKLDPVPSYATAIEGATGIVLSKDGSQVLAVWERRAWSTPGGAVNPGESKLETLEREVYEELRAEVDLSRGATMVGGWSQARARDNLVNDSFGAFVVHLKHDVFEPDDREISEARFFEWRPLLETWRERGRPNEKPVKMDLGLPDAVARGSNGETRTETRNLVSLNLLQWLDTYELGGGLVCKPTEDMQADKKACKVVYLGSQLA